MPVNRTMDKLTSIHVYGGILVVSELLIQQLREGTSRMSHGVRETKGTF